MTEIFADRDAQEARLEYERPTLAEAGIRPAHTKAPFPHIHVDVYGVMREGGPAAGGSYCMWHYKGWKIDEATASLVLGRGVPRTHIPLIHIASFELKDPPDWCKQTDPVERVDE